MYIALICDAYPPMRSSGAVQMRDLYIEFIKQGHQPTVVLPSPDLDSAWHIEEWNGGQIFRVKAPKTKDIGYVGRTIGEFWLPFVISPDHWQYFGLFMTVTASKGTAVCC